MPESIRSCTCKCIQNGPKLYRYHKNKCMQVVPQLNEYHKKCTQSAQIYLLLHGTMHTKCPRAFQIPLQSACKSSRRFVHSTKNLDAECPSRFAPARKTLIKWPIAIRISRKKNVYKLSCSYEYHVQMHAKCLGLLAPARKNI